MIIYYVSFNTATVRSESLDYDPPIRNTVFIPRELLTHEVMGHYMLTNPNYNIIPIEPGDKIQRTMFLIAVEDKTDIADYVDLNRIDSYL